MERAPPSILCVTPRQSWNQNHGSRNYGTHRGSPSGGHCETLGCYKPEFVTAVIARLIVGPFLWSL